MNNLQWTMYRTAANILTIKLEQMIAWQVHYVYTAMFIINITFCWYCMCSSAI